MHRFSATWPHAGKSHWMALFDSEHSRELCVYTCFVSPKIHSTRLMSVNSAHQMKKNEKEWNVHAWNSNNLWKSIERVSSLILPLLMRQAGSLKYLSLPLMWAWQTTALIIWLHLCSHGGLKKCIRLIKGEISQFSKRGRFCQWASA